MRKSIDKSIDKELNRIRIKQMIGEIRKSKYKSNLFREIDEVIKELKENTDGSN